MRLGDSSRITKSPSASVLLPTDVYELAEQVVQQGFCQQNIIQALQGILSHVDALQPLASVLSAAPVAPQASRVTTKLGSSPLNYMLHLAAQLWYDGGPKACQGFIHQTPFSTILLLTGNDPPRS